MSMPATYDEPKGFTLLEAMANGVPVVQPNRGAFTEIMERTGGEILVTRTIGRARRQAVRMPPRSAAPGARKRPPALHCRPGGRRSGLRPAPLTDAIVTNLTSYPVPEARSRSSGHPHRRCGQSVAIMGTVRLRARSAPAPAASNLQPPARSYRRPESVDHSRQDQAMLRGSRIGFVFQDRPAATVVGDRQRRPRTMPGDRRRGSGRSLLTRVGTGDRLDHRPPGIVRRRTAAWRSPAR